MTIPGFKLGASNERTSAAAGRHVDAQPSTSYPPPLPDVDAPAPADELHAAPRADASTAPTIRPPASALTEAASAPPAPSPAPSAPAPASTSPAAHAMTSASERNDSLGFTSVIRHLSLRSWLRWIHSNRSDATLRVRTRDGRNGRIWCNAGVLIDAEWGRFGAEEAVREMLSLSSGAVTIDFDPIDRPRRITRSTQELLRLPEGSHGRFTDMAHAEAALAASAAGGVRSEPFRSTLFLPSSAPASAHPVSSLRPRRDPRRISRGEYLAGMLLLAALAVAAFSFGRMRAASQEVELAEALALQTEQTKSGLLPPPPPQQATPEGAASTPKPLDLPLIPFVAIEVEPPRAEIWLDQELIGLGRIQLAAIQDGKLHELRFMAPGHETKSLFFRDAPPAGRVRLAPIPDAPIVAEATQEETSEATNEALTKGAAPTAEIARDGERESSRRVMRRRAPPPPPRERPAAEPAPQPAAKSVQPRKSPQVQLIEVHTPRVQVLD